MTNFAEIAKLLEQSPDHRVLRRLKFRDHYSDVAKKGFKIGVLLDVETTGLDTASDEIVELGMVKFTYAPNGIVGSVVGTYSCLNEPTKPIPPETTRLHGITDELVAGQRIDSAEVCTFIQDANIVIAHNASFDRRFAERFWQPFVDMPWGCSVTEVDWRSIGFEGSRLGYLLAGIGMFHEAHRAVDDCRALLEILAHEIPATGRTTLSYLLDQARRKTTRIWAEHSPFDLKDELKKRGYRWSPGENGNPKAWFIDADDSQLESELTFLKTEIYRREVDLRMQSITAADRYSVRI